MKISIYVIVFAIIAVIIVAAALSTVIFNKSLSSKNVTLSNLPNLGQAPNIQGISYWINSPPLNMSSLKGKVVLVDFWTYSCINCIRTIPYLNAWESKYGNNGLVIIGVHTPEFQFEHNYTNVLNAVQKFGIKYPVAMDNNYDTWIAYNNMYWPADYLIDANGTIRYEQFGEGNYNVTETVIQELLQQAGYNAPTGLINVTSSTNFSQIESPEIYLGWSKAREQIGNAQGFQPNKTVNYTFTNITNPNVVYFKGEWYNAPDGMVAVNNSSMFLVYKAKDVNIVASGNATISVKLDGRPLNQSSLGSDDRLVNGSTVATINSSRLYNVVATPGYAPHVIEIDASPGFKVYTFTFG